MTEGNKTVLTEKWKNILITIAVFAILCVGFTLGRCTTEVKTVTTTKYIKGDTVKETIYEPKPYKVTEPIDTLNFLKQCIKDGIYKELWPNKVVTEYIEKSDSSKIIKDWATKREYTEILFKNDTLGSCSFNAEVQYNRLRLINYSFEPVVRQVVKETRVIRKFEPFIGVSVMVNPWDNVRNPMLGVSGGFYIKEHYGISLQLQHAFKSKADYVGGTLFYKF